jgi:hypothetical protein
MLVRKKCAGGGQLMDVIFVDAQHATAADHMRAKDHLQQAMHNMPEHFPVLAVPREALARVDGFVRASPKRAFIPSKEKGAAADYIGFDLRNCRIRFPVTGERAVVTHEADETVTLEAHGCEKQIRWEPLSMLADMNALAGAAIDASALAVPRPKHSPVSAIMSLSGGQIACIEPPLLFNLTIWGFPTAGEPLLRRVAGSVEQTLDTSGELVLEIDDLDSGRPIGCLTIDATKISPEVPLKFKNVPSPDEQLSKEDCQAMHFAALYSLFPNRKNDPVPRATLLCEGPKGLAQTCEDWAKRLDTLKKQASAETTDVSPSCMGAFAFVDEGIR